MRLSEILYIFYPTSRSWEAAGLSDAPRLKSALNVHLVTGLVRSYLEETILLKEEEYGNQAGALSEKAGDKCAPVITFLFSASRTKRKKAKEGGGSCKLQLSLIG